jgi:hypothetical protein
MKFFNFKDSKNTSQFDNLQDNILNCLGKSLKDEELRKFISKYKIVCEDKYSMNLFSCSNDFLTFQNKDQRKQTIEEFHIVRNNTWLPYNIDYNDQLENVIDKLGKPDLFDFDHNVYWYYDKLILISFENIQNMKSHIKEITFNDSLKNKPSEDELCQWRNARLKALSKPESKSFGYNSKWIIIKSSNVSDVLKAFNTMEHDKSSWTEGFKHATISNNGIFISQITEGLIIVYGWSIPYIENNSEFFTKLSSTLGEIYYFENDYKTPFAWAFIKDGLIKRAFKEEYFKDILNIGEETEYEKKHRIQSEREKLLVKEEEYSSDQDIRKEYREYMTEQVLKIADNWIFNPLKLDDMNLPDEVFINKNYR